MACSCFYSEFLNGLGLSEYDTRFLSQGYESIIDIAMMNKIDLQNLSISNADHEKVILEAIDNLPLKSWLQEYNLVMYDESFKQEGIKTVKDIKALRITADLLDKLDIMVPGHRKRLTMHVQLLQTSHQYDAEQSRGPFHPNAVAAVGYWSRPETLHRLEHDFLCVKGCFKSGLKEDDQQSEFLEFLLDSASDVVTTRPEIIEGLGLDYIKDVDTYGIHTVAKKPIYKGYLRLGNSHWMEVEVQPGDYESIGSTVMRNFCHWINGTFHQWLPAVN